MAETRGKIERVVADGSGPDSAEVLIRLKDTQGNFQSFWIFVPNPYGRDKFFSNLRVAFEAMWDQGDVKITWALYNGDQTLLSIEPAR